jgi:SAM-dependent methyltransferase
MEIVERDDGFIAAGKLAYFAPVRRWPSVERRALRWVRGRVLDVGLGAGRVALALQERGHDVVGIDISPLAVEVARRRGVRDARLATFETVDETIAPVDTVVMFGNNFGLFGLPARARRLLRRLHQLTTDRGRIVATSTDVYATEDPEHLEYHRRNRERGRMSGQLRLRVRYRSLATPWFDYLLTSPDEMAELANGGGWTARTFIRDDGRFYVGVLEKGPAT